MLDVETKRKIDNCRDILVGKVPDPKGQVEQITIALIYKFMDDMDAQSIDMGGKPSFFVGEYEKYSWSSIFDPHTSGFELLNRYGEALVKLEKNPKIPQLFRDIFKNAYLPYRDPETLRAFLKEIRNFSYDHSERLGDSFEYLLSVLSSQGEAGQFRTPRHIIDFIVEVVKPQKHEKILDPACGTAGFLISAYKHILKNNPKLSMVQKKHLMDNFVGYDISYDMVRLSLVNMYLHGFSQPHISEYDTLTYEDRWDDTFDVIMANPPFMSPKGGIRPHSRFAIRAKRSEVLFVDYIAVHLNPSGRAGVIVPEGIIFQSQNAYKALRKMLVENYLWAVVSLPAGVFNPYSGVKTSILLMDKSLAKRIDKVLFIKIENDGFDLGAQRRPIDKNDLPAALKFLNIYKSKIENYESQIPDDSFAHAILKSKIAQSGDYNLSGDRYKTIDIQQRDWPMEELGNICEIINGYAFKSKNYVDYGIRVIRITNVQRGKIVDSDPKFYPLVSKESIDRYKLFEGDLLISLTGNVGRIGLLPKEYLPAALNQRVACLRIKKKEIINKIFLFYLLNVMNFEQSCIDSSKGLAQKNLSTIWLSKYKVPIPPLDVQKAIVAEIDNYQKIIDGARQVVDNYKPKIKIDPDWPLVELGKLCDLISGQHILSEDYNENDNGIPYLTGPIDFGPLYPNISKYTSKPKVLAQNNDLLITVKGSGIGKLNILNIAEAAISRQLMAIRPKSIELFYLYTILSNMYDHFQKKGAGTAIPGLDRNDILSIAIPLPSVDEQNKIVSQIKSEQQAINANKKLIEVFEQKIKDKIAEVWGE